MMTPYALLGCVVGSLVIGAVAAAAQPEPKDARVRAELQELSARTLFFGHQSVGRNILDGVKQLAAGEGVPLRVVETKGAAAGIAPKTFAHGEVPENGDPVRKLRSFEQALTSGGPVDIAFVKFCYVDIGPGTDVAALFAEYQATMARLKAQHPATTFVHVTAPLTTLQGGWKAAVKKVLGRLPQGVVENARREEFNALLRKAVEGKEPLFDLARAESTRPDGTPETFEWSGRRIPALVSEYSDDGGHLNGKGRLVAARRLVSVLAAVPARDASASR
jgi:hypothetical protein